MILQAFTVTKTKEREKVEETQQGSFRRPPDAGRAGGRLYSVLNAEEIGSLLGREKDKVRSFLVGLGVDYHEMDDIVQAVFLKFIEKSRQGEIARDTAVNYLYAIARNAFFDVYRRRNREVALQDFDELCEDDDAIRARILSREIRSVLVQGVDDPELPEKIRDVLRRRFLEGDSLEDIQNSLQVSRATIYRFLEKGIAHLGQKFRQAGLDIDTLEQ